jgi:hypothetical protein
VPKANHVAAADPHRRTAAANRGAGSARNVHAGHLGTDELVRAQRTDRTHPAVVSLLQPQRGFDGAIVDLVQHRIGGGPRSNVPSELFSFRSGQMSGTC